MDKKEQDILIAELRHAERPLCDMAANEIERLAAEVKRLSINYKEENASAQRQWVGAKAELAQSDAEDVTDPIEYISKALRTPEYPGVKVPNLYLEAAGKLEQLSEENEQLAERNKVLEDTIDRLQERYG